MKRTYYNLYRYIPHSDSYELYSKKKLTKTQADIIIGTNKFVMILTKKPIKEN